jgi:FKBP-type peptidyl-prolyl cis-trans isomerase
MDLVTRRSSVNRFLTVVFLAALIGCGGDTGSTPDGPTSLQIEDVTVGTGATLAAGDTMTVNYVGTFLDGRVFDQASAFTFPFPIGVGRFIAGFDQGLIGMKVGGKRRLTIPSNLAYGSAGAPPTIPPNTPLRFEVDLLAIAGK